MHQRRAWGCLQEVIGQGGMEREERYKNYRCDVVYLTNSELGFDYLRSNLAFSEAHIVQRPLFYCIVDEIDSILIDEARTPLIISNEVDTPVDKYHQSTKLARALLLKLNEICDPGSVLFEHP